MIPGRTANVNTASDNLQVLKASLHLIRRYLQQLMLRLEGRLVNCQSDRVSYFAASGHSGVWGLLSIRRHHVHRFRINAKSLRGDQGKRGMGPSDVDGTYQHME